MQQQVHVRCFEGEIALADLRALEAEPSPQKWAISQMRIAPSAREYAESCPSLHVYNLSDFMRLIWGPYFDSLVALVEEGDIHRYYVDLGCHRKQVGEEGSEITRDTYPIIDEYIDNWISERGRLHISILGEFGTGKTWFCRHFAYRQLNRYLSNPIGERLPLLITLRSFSKAMTAQQLINDALLEQYRLPFAGSAFDIFQEMNRRGKLLLILDGFDEMARKVDYQTVVDNFWELARLALEASKVLLTSRVEYFRWAKESEQVLGGKELGRSMISIKPPKFEVLYLEPLSGEQIEEVIVKRMGPENGPAIAQGILGKSNLAELARRPVLIELLLSALPQIGAREEVSEAQVYLYATNELLLRNIAEDRTFTSTADKLLFLCELAWTMIASGELRIHYTDIPERIQTWFGDHIQDKPELDHWDYDLRSQTLLHRNAAGYYEFAHKSLAEFFVAYKFAAELGCLALEFSQAYREAGGKSCRMPIEEKDVISLAETFGAIPLKDAEMLAVRNFLTEMIDEGAAERLWQVIDETKGKAPESVQYIGGNAGTLLGRKQESFVNAELERAVLTGLEVWSADLSGANLRRAVLIDAELSNPTMRNTDLRYCDLQRIELKEHGWTSATWEPNDRCLLTASGSDAILWDPRNWSPIARQEFPFAEGTHLAKISWNPDGSQVMAISKDGEIALWHTRTQALEIIGSFRPYERPATVSNNGAWILTRAYGEISLWRVSDDISGQLAANSLRIEAASSLSDREGFRALVWVREGDLWKLEVRVVQARKFGTLEGLKRSGFHTFSPGAKFLGCMSFHEEDMPRVRDVQVVRVDTQETLMEIVPTTGQPANDICFDPFERQVAFISGPYAVSVHDLESGEELVTLGDPDQHGTYISSLTYNSAGTRIAAARFDSTTVVWDLASGHSLAVLPQRVDCCLGAQIVNAIGLSQVGYGPCNDQTLEEWLVARGAVGRNQR